MLSNKEVANMFHELASLMELHEENPFKIRSYENAYLSLRKMDAPLMDQDRKEWAELKGIGTAILDKLTELKNTGSFKTLEEFRDKTPEGIRQLLKVKGLGPKKLKSIWQELHVETPGELLYACEENRLVELKGFGPKIQDDIRKSLEFFDNNQGSFLYAVLETEAEQILMELKKRNPDVHVEMCGALQRKMPVLNDMELIANAEILQLPEQFQFLEGQKYIWKDRFPVTIHTSDKVHFVKDRLLLTGGSIVFKEKFLDAMARWDAPTERELFTSNALPYIPAESRDLEHFDHFKEEDLVEDGDIKGVIHNHSTYSDGMYSIADMANECIRLGYHYLVISDHSRTAVYANGLSMERVEQQWREIDALNAQFKNFKIYKSIESDILYDGNLDYPDDFLRGFDLVIASVHSQLKMDEPKAMMRLMKAIEHPATRILGHPTGRLLLSRPGYPIQHTRIIDACAANKVAIEINANPLRLDLDWSWLPYAMKRGVLISINPDAHNLKGIKDIRYGVFMARKGGLTKNNCLNCRSIAEFETWIQSKNRF